MKLIKLKNDHYIIVADSEIKEGDWVLYKSSYIATVLGFPTDGGGGLKIQVVGDNAKIKIDFSSCKKITHSTQPLEVYEKDPQWQMWDKVTEINLSKIKELIGEMDVDKKVSEHFKNYWKKEDGTEMSRDEITADMMTNMLMETSAYNAGYNQALEDKKDKKYTEEDLRTALWELGDVLFNNNQHGIQEKEPEKYFDDIIESLQPQTGWEVEFIDGKLKLK